MPLCRPWVSVVLVVCVMAVFAALGSVDAAADLLTAYHSLKSYSRWSMVREGVSLARSPSRDFSPGRAR